jgi:hypothetical protein
MVCMPGPDPRRRASAPGDAFAFSGGRDAAERTFENAAVLWSTPWRAFWAVAFETMDPANYRR